MSTENRAASLTAALNQVVMTANEEIRGAYTSMIQASQTIGSRRESLLGAKRIAAYAPKDPIIDEVAPALRGPYDTIFNIVNFALTELSAGKSDPKFLVTLGHCYLMLGDYPNAYIWYSRALSIEHPNDGYCWFGAGVVCHHLKLFDDAIQIYQQVLRFESMIPFASEVMLRLAFAQRSVGQFDESIATLMRVQQCLPQGLSEDDIRFHLAFTYQLAGQLRIACSWYQDLFQKHQNCLPILQQYLWFLSLQPDPSCWKLAQDIIDRLPPDQRVDPLIIFTDARLSMKTCDTSVCFEKYCACNAYWNSYAIFWCGLGVLYVKSEQFADAVFAYHYALKRNKELYEAWANIGYISELQGDINGAIQIYQSAIENCGNLPIFCERLARLNSKRMDVVMSGQRGLIEVDESRYFTQPAELVAQAIVDSTPRIPFSEVTGFEVDNALMELISTPLKSILT